jgi:hypothetical protein
MKESISSFYWLLLFARWGLSYHSKIPELRFASSGMTSGGCFAPSGMTGGGCFDLSGMTGGGCFTPSGMTGGGCFTPSGMTSGGCFEAMILTKAIMFLLFFKQIFH